MEWLAPTLERDLGIDQWQTRPSQRPNELVVLVPTRWLMALRNKRVTHCARYECFSEGEICTLLQRSQMKLPSGWTRVCIQGLRKHKLGYRLAKEPDCHGEGLSQDSFMTLMQGVSQSNFRNLWHEAYTNHVQPYADSTEQTQVVAIDAVRQALQKLFCCSFISTDRVSPSLSPAKEKEKDCPFPSSSSAIKQSIDSLCPNVLPAECLLESEEVFYVVFPYTQYTVHDIVTYSPAKLANSHAKILFILYQLLVAMRECHASGLLCGELSLLDIAVDEQLCSRLKISLAHYERFGEYRNAMPCALGSQVPTSVTTKDNQSLNNYESGHLCQNCLHKLKSLVLDWVHGHVSNFHYLMELNRLAGRREGDPNYHPVLPWVVDFTVPYGRFRDLKKSKFRLNKGDKQLDFTYEMTKEALAAAAANGSGGSNFASDLSGPGGPCGSGQSDHLHVPHHISDVLSDITYYVYKARQTPKSVLCSHVRSQWEPNEYPASMERIQSWTPDECIPEFYTDPSIFRSIHPDMPDLDVPPWCNSYEEFIAVHRQLLESRDVSQQLHHWIDLTFGYKLSGKEAIKAKNVCLHLVDNHTHLTSYGVVQLFDHPHPPRLAPYQYSPPEPPHFGPVSVTTWHIPPLETTMDSVDGLVPEATGCEFSGWSMVGRDELEQGMEALDLSGSVSSATSVPIPLVGSSGGKTASENAALAISPSHGSFPGETTVNVTNNLGSGIRASMLQRPAPVSKKPEVSNFEDFKISLPEGFKPFQPLEELEKLNNFLVKGLHSQVQHTMNLEMNKNDVRPVLKSPLSFTDLFQRDMQALGVLIAEMFYSSKLQGLGPGTHLSDRFQAVLKLCSTNLRDVPLPLHHALETLLQIHKHSFKTESLTLHSLGLPFLFRYDPVYEGLPPPNPWQLLSPVLSPLPFPAYFATLHRFIFTYYSKIESINSVQGRDIVFSLWQQLETLLKGDITAEGLEILLPFVLALMLEESTAVYAAWYLFEPVSRVLGPRNATKYLLKPLVGVYENPRCLRGRFYLYTDCFVLQLIVRLGLQAFLSNLLPHVLQIITGFDGCNRGTGSQWEGLKVLRGAAGAVDEEEEDFECEDGRSSAATSTGKVGGGSGGGSGGAVGDQGLADYSSGISLNDQVFLTEGEDFQNGFYVNNSASGAATGLAAKQQSQSFVNKDQDQESLSVGKLSDKSSASEVSIGDRASLKSVDSSPDLKQASDGEDGGELEDEEETEDDREITVQRVPSLEMTLSVCTEDSEGTVATLEGDIMNGMVQGDAEKNMEEEDTEHDTLEDSEEKEHKILLDTVCKTVRWLSAKLGPTLTSRYIARHLLRLLTTCYIGPEKHQFVLSGNEENSLESVGSVYEKKPVVGDQTARPVLESLIYMAHLYGEPVLTYQYLPYIGYLVSPPSSCRLNTRKEAGLLGAVVLTQKIIVFLSDTTLMDMLMKINQEVLLPLLDLLTSAKMGFPSGVQTRSAVCLKTLSLIALICLRIGREMVQQHMAETLCRFFQVFSLLHSLQNQMGSAPRREVGDSTYLDVCIPDGTIVTCELGVLEQLQAVFNPEMAYASYIPFYCLIGDAAIRKLVTNYELVWSLAQSFHERASPGSPEANPPGGQRASTMGLSPSTRRQMGRSPIPAPSSTSTPLGGDIMPESGTFGSHLVGNRIQVPRDTEVCGSPNLSSVETWGWPYGSHAPQTSLATTALSSAGPSFSLSSSSWVMGPTPEDSALKQDLSRSSRSLQGNWLAYWQYEIGLNQQDSHFHFHQIRLQSFLGHSGTAKCLAPLAMEDYFLSGSKDKTVKLWPLYNHGDGTREVKPRLTYTEHRKSVFYVGQLEALQEVVSCDGTVHLWDQFTGKNIRCIEALDGKNPITAVTTMPAPHCSVMFASADSVLRFIDPRKPGLQHEFRLAYSNMSAGLIRCLAVSPGGRTVAAGFSTGFIVLLDARTGLVLRGWPAHEGDILQMKAAEGNLLISSSSDHTLSVWKDVEHKPLHQYRTPSDPIHAFDLYGAEIVAGTVANKIGVYSILDNTANLAGCTKLSSENFRGTLTSLSVLPTKRLLLLGSENGAIRLLA
ncbi:WD repeat-containing protein 81-like isoform X2 [Myxocyprinus asiaticus]|nr:WD repeat-containing protein 81-like isoform X2 [Myxocyprinus asiaticus]XP_051535861.1 WD repeat-containing protein 81-like isoform X2 [Myxocyprinus asiaticus]XP_051535862.1 WD repeat-containing protein 81-like isoform X2 [Myxocyprinus asiaticus]